MNDDDFVDFLSEQGRSGVAALHLFRLSYAEGAGQVHVFLEGDDDALFYLAHVRARLAGKELFTYFCGGKWGVTSARDLLEADGCVGSCLFFVDRDFDDFFDKQPDPKHNLYITDGYSIESELVCGAALDVVLFDLARMARADPAHKATVEAWPVEEAEFATAIKPILAWVLAMRDASKKPNLNNVDLKKVIAFRDGKWKRRKNGFEIFVKATCRADESVPALAIRKWIGRLKVGDEKIWIRGKYALWWFEAFLLSRLTNEGVKARRWSIPAAVRERRLFDVLGARIPAPASLVVFLDGCLGAPV